MGKLSLKMGFIKLAAIFAVASAGAQPTPTMLIYCGITMVNPISMLAKNFELRENVKIQIAQGGSDDLYHSAKKSQLGDLYFPGEPSFYQRYQNEGLFGEYRLIGYNQLAIFVSKDNPKQVKSDLRDLLRKDLILILGNQQSGSIGLESKEVLEKFHLFEPAMSKSSFLMPDSRSLNLSLKKGDADITLNWRATAFFPENSPFIDIIDLPTHVAKPQALLLIKLNFSKNRELTEKFVNYAASVEGQSIFRNWGFMDASGRTQHKKIP